MNISTFSWIHNRSWKRNHLNSIFHLLVFPCRFYLLIQKLSLSSLKWILQLIADVKIINFPLGAVHCEQLSSHKELCKIFLRTADQTPAACTHSSLTFSNPRGCLWAGPRISPCCTCNTIPLTISWRGGRRCVGWGRSGDGSGDKSPVSARVLFLAPDSEHIETCSSCELRGIKRRVSILWESQYPDTSYRHVWSSSSTTLLIRLLTLARGGQGAGQGRGSVMYGNPGSVVTSGRWWVVGTLDTLTRSS